MSLRSDEHERGCLARMNMLKSVFRSLHIALILTMFPALARAEVMDKSLSLASIWIWAGLFGIIGYSLCRWRVWLVFIALPLALFLPLAAILELIDPHMGPAIAQEAGTLYAIQVYLVTTLVLVAHVVGIIGRMRRRRRQEAHRMARPKTDSS
jgi:hypothetical protein